MTRDDEEADALLGKRTRSGRMTRQAKSNLNEDEMYRDIDKALEDSKEDGGKEMIQPYSAKRVR